MIYVLLDDNSIVEARKGLSHSSYMLPPRDGGGYETDCPVYAQPNHTWYQVWRGSPANHAVSVEVPNDRKPLGYRTGWCEPSPQDEFFTLE